METNAFDFGPLGGSAGFFDVGTILDLSKAVLFPVINNLWVIFSMEETRNFSEGIYWNNKDGWTTLDSATVFTESEKEKLYLPMPDGEWVQLPKIEL